MLEGQWDFAPGRRRVDASVPSCRHRLSDSFSRRAVIELNWVVRPYVRGSYCCSWSPVIHRTWTYNLPDWYPWVFVALTWYLHGIDCTKRTPILLAGSRHQLNKGSVSCMT
jgi:hypothetical protein